MYRLEFVPGKHQRHVTVCSSCGTSACSHHYEFCRSSCCNSLAWDLCSCWSVWILLRVTGSVAFLVEISLRSSWKIFLFFIKNHVYRIKVLKKTFNSILQKPSLVTGTKPCTDARRLRSFSLQSATASPLASNVASRPAYWMCWWSTSWNSRPAQ